MGTEFIFVLMGLAIVYVAFTLWRIRRLSDENLRLKNELREKEDRVNLLKFVCLNYKTRQSKTGDAV